jgi:DNA-directed RNA polymerase specialized sigma24 family protein
MTGLAVETKKTKTLPIIEEIVEKDPNVVTDYLDKYGNLIWALARKFTSSIEEAEAATQEIFIDIWQYGEQNKKINSDENFLIALIARRRLAKYLQTNIPNSI